MESRVARLEVRVEGLEKDAAHDENKSEEQLKEIFDRLRTLERMAWIAIGSTVAFSTIATYFRSTILKILGK